MSANKLIFYPPAEERLNILTHALGTVLSIAALVFLVVRAASHGDVWHIVSFSIFGTSLIALFASSTSYHCVKKPRLRNRLRVLDHAAIYILIAGTYTPFTLVTLQGTVGWTVFGISWSMAVVGIVLKLFFTGRYSLISTLLYVAMGWIIVFAIKPLIDTLPAEGLYWLVAGGVAYTLGAILYSINAIKFNHAIFHIFVLIGSACHFIAVYWYVLPT